MAQKEEHSKQRRIFNYHWIVDNIGFFLFLAVLAVVYIANGHTADKTIREINKTSKEIKELQFEYKTVKSELMYQTREEAIVKSAGPLGLKISTTPPARIKNIVEKPNKASNH